MRPSVTLIKGLHVTASDKRTILEGIEHLRTTFAPCIEDSPETQPAYAKVWIGRKGSPKRYSIEPMDRTGLYSVVIRANYRTDHGQMREGNSTLMIQTKGIEPLYQPPATDLFSIHLPENIHGGAPKARGQ